MDKSLELLSSFDFDLPKELIAQTPVDKRDHSNLLIVGQKDLIITPFYNIIDYLQDGNLIIFNNSRVIKAKLILYKHTSGKPIELYLNKNLGNNKWHGFVKPARKIEEQEEFNIDGHKIIFDKKLEMGQVEVIFDLKENLKIFEFLEAYGHMPLPPYIKRPYSESSINSHEDETRYQTIFNQIPGSVAAPTAALHFTENLLNKIKAKNIQIEYITLHVGAGTFLPIKTEDINEHRMHSEHYNISALTALNINKAILEKRRIIAVGTTTLRCLESAYKEGKIGAGEVDTAIFIKPGFKFKVANMLVTNFHLPKSTLFILTCAFAGYKNMHLAYRYAIQNKMRFFSYGDAMLLNLNKDE